MIETERLTLRVASQGEMERFIAAQTDEVLIAASQRVLAKCGFVPTGTVGEEGPRFVREK